MDTVLKGVSVGGGKNRDRNNMKNSFLESLRYFQSRPRVLTLFEQRVAHFDPQSNSFSAGEEAIV